jgi:hypothetical protein
VFDDPALQSAAFSAQWERQPLWEAVREACESTNLRVTPPEQAEFGTAVLRLSRGQERAPSAIDGLAIVRLHQLTRDASISYADGNQRTPDTVRIGFRVLLDPKVRGWAWMEPPRITRAVDARGHALATTRPAGERARGTTYFSSREVTALLEYPRNAGKKLAVVEGSIPLQVASEMATVTFHHPLGHAGDMAADVGANRLLLKNFTRDESGQFKLVLVLTRGEKETDERWNVVAELVSRFALRIALICPNGPAKQNGGGGDRRDNYVRTELQFPPHEADDQPMDVQVVIPTAFTAAAAKFQFKDVPMP